MIEILSCIFIIGFGTLCHFIYEASGEKKWCAFLFPVNESVWEHVKMYILPSFLWMIVEFLLYSSNPNYLTIKLISMLSVIIFIPLVFYIVFYIMKKESIIASIIEFILDIIIGQIVFYRLLLVESNFSFGIFAIIGLLLIFVCYALFTFFPPKIFLFEDSTNGKYGIKAHTNYHH